MNQTNMTINLELLGKTIAHNMAPSTPLNKTPWCAQECAAYLRIECKTFLSVYAPLPSFPRPIKPTTATGKGHPKWNAQKVVDWFFSHEEETIRRRRPKKKARQE